MFRVVDQVIQSGQDPERFVQDLLERFRDVVIVKAAPEQAPGILHGMPADQLRRLEAQAQQLGPAEVSRAADITAAALTQMSGATSPRLHLELLMARLMLPATDETERGLAARIDRLERRIEYGGVPEAAAEQPAAKPVIVRSEQTGLSGAAAARAALGRDQEQADEQPEDPAPQPARPPVAEPQPAPRQAQPPRQAPQPEPAEPSVEPTPQPMPAPSHRLRSSALLHNSLSNPLHNTPRQRRRNKPHPSSHPSHLLPSSRPRLRWCAARGQKCSSF